MVSSPISGFIHSFKSSLFHSNHHFLKKEFNQPHLVFGVLLLRRLITEFLLEMLPLWRHNLDVGDEMTILLMHKTENTKISFQCSVSLTAFERIRVRQLIYLTVEGVSEQRKCRYNIYRQTCHG